MNLLVTITGPSATGKSTLERMLVERGFAKMISVTTRLPRSGEKDGVDYYFITKEEFIELEAGNKLLETVMFSGSQYGVSEDEAERAFAANKPVVVVVDPDGARQIKRAGMDRGWRVVSIFLQNRLDVLVSRFLQRFHEDEGANSVVAAHRLINLIDTEYNWVYRENWDLVYSGFGKSIEDFVLGEICSLPGA